MAGDPSSAEDLGTPCGVPGCGCCSSGLRCVRGVEVVKRDDCSNSDDAGCTAHFLEADGDQGRSSEDSSGFLHQVEAIVLSFIYWYDFGIPSDFGLLRD